jgi:hypothetical protein
MGRGKPGRLRDFQEEKGRKVIGGRLVEQRQDGKPVESLHRCLSREMRQSRQEKNDEVMDKRVDHSCLLL